MKVTGTYLTFNGNCREAMTFYSDVFGSKIRTAMTFGDHPPPGDQMKCMDRPVTEELKNRMMHMSLMIGDSFVLMASDTHPMMHKNPLQPGNNYQICLEPNTKEEAIHYFSALEKGGCDAMPLQDMFWGSYHGSLTDKFGVRWMFDMPSSSASSDEERLQQAIQSASKALRESAQIACATAAKLDSLVDKPVCKNLMISEGN